MSKQEHKFPLCSFHRFVDRSGIRDVFSICFCQCPSSESLADMFFICRVNILRITNIHNHNHSCVFHRHSLKLGFTQKMRPRVHAIIIWSNLYIVEWKFTALKIVSPSGNERCKQLTIQPSIRYVIFTLIPDCTFDGEWNQGVDHSVEERSW